MKTVIIGKCLLPDILKHSRLSQVELSYKTGIKVEQLSRYINNKNTMSLQTALLISWVLKCDVTDLYDYKIR